MSSERSRRQAEYVARIQQALRDKKLVIIVGAGVSLGAVQPPPPRITWTGLISNGLDYLEDEGFVESDNEELIVARSGLKEQPMDVPRLLRICHYLKDVMDQHALYPTWLDSVFGKLHESVTNPEILQALGRAHDMGAKLLTTNFDELLEHFCHLRRICPSDLDEVRKYEQGISKGVFHIHGSFQDPGDVVLDAVDYYKVKASENVQSLLKAYIAHSTILFVGCGSGLDDPNFGSLLEWASSRAENIPNHHYLLVRNGDTIRNRPLINIRYGQDHADLGPYLQGLFGDGHSGQHVGLTPAPAISTSDSWEVLVEIDLTDAEQNTSLPMEGTCQWILDVPQFISWKNDSEQSRMVCIHGPLGSGKSTLMRHIVKFFKEPPQSSDQILLAFFVGSNNTPGEVYRSLLVQLLRMPEFSSHVDTLMKTWSAPITSQVSHPLQHSLGTILQEYLRKRRRKQVVITIDAVDKCTDPESLLQFFQDLVTASVWSPIKVCFTSRQTYPILHHVCESIYTGTYNQDDIVLYIESRLEVRSLIGSTQQNLLHQAIEKKSSGIFLWVALVINILREYVNQGKDYSYLNIVLEATPKEMMELYRNVLRHSLGLNERDERQTITKVFQWVLFSARFLGIEEWFHIFAFIDKPDLCSIEEWKSSPFYTESRVQLLQRINRLCGGLVDVKDRILPKRLNGVAFDAMSTDSTKGRAGSFETYEYIDVIHESVRTFFQEEDAFAILNDITADPIGEGHAYILDVCIRYSYLAEMVEVFAPESQIASQAQSIRSKSSVRIHELKETNIEEVEDWITDDEDEDASDKMSLGSSAASSGRSSRSGRSRRRRGRLNFKKHTRYFFSENMPHLSLVTSFNTLALKTPKPGQPTSIMSDYLKCLDRAGLRTLHGNLARSIPISPTKSLGSRSRLFESAVEPPVLWLYCQHWLVHHATAVETTKLVPSKTLDFLISHKDTSWTATQEDMQHEATSAYFASRWNLVLWLKQFSSTDLLNRRGGKFGYPIVVASKYRCHEAFEYLLAELGGSGLTCYDARHRSALHYATMIPDNHILRTIYTTWTRHTSAFEAVDIDQMDGYGWTALHLAILHGSKRDIEQMLELGADVSICDLRGHNTALHLACFRKVSDYDLCKLLVEAGCNHRLRNKAGMTALQYVQNSGDSRISQYLASLMNLNRYGDGENLWTQRGAKRQNPIFDLMSSDSSTDDVLPDSAGHISARQSRRSLIQQRSSQRSSAYSHRQREAESTIQRQSLRSRLGSCFNCC